MAAMKLVRGWKRRFRKMQASNKNGIKKIEMIVERTKTGYPAYAKKYPAHTAGKSLEELKAQNAGGSYPLF